MCQQSPSFGSLPTGATSAHHLVTPTRLRFAPMAHKIEVALGASETMRSGALRFALMVTGMRIADSWVPRGLLQRGLTPRHEYVALRCLTPGGLSCVFSSLLST